MAVYKTPKNLTLGYSPSVKPTVPVVIDWSNPLSSKCRFFALLTPDNLADLVSGKMPTVPNGSLSFVGTEAGLAFNPALTNSLRYDSLKLGVNAGDSMCMVIHTMNDELANPQTTTLFAGASAYQTNESNHFYIKDKSWTPNVDLVMSLAGIVYLPKDFGYSTIAMFLSGGTTYASAYKNGQLIGTDTSVQATISDAVQGTRIAIGSDIYNGNLYNNPILSVSMYVGLSEQEVKILSENPYQLLKPQIETFYYTAGSGTTHNLLADDVESSSEVTSPAITQVHALTATSAQSTSEVTTATLTQVHALLANDIESASEVTTPTLTEGTHNLLANDVESNSELTTPTLAQIHNLLATSVQSLSQVSSPTLNRPDTLITETTATFALVNKTLTIKNRTMTISVD